MCIRDRIKVDTDELKPELNNEVSNEMIMFESHQIHINSCHDVKEPALNAITRAMQVALKLLSPETDTLHHLDFLLSRKGIDRNCIRPVSYTHLTLPTICSV
eukprot:TRINITY_DN4204_c0_g1_i2.p2 TRINITY_DN4204_c0_g1~~TRINITY_DN4204_c0_g1_i2.p2  ORF type:complete len:102 (-),score=18.77 TRINITY_DN4204_c0_g1_i2:35-340(-)